MLTKLTRYTRIAGTCAAFFASSSVLALEADSAALGGSAIANTDAAFGALENPASLMRTKKQSQVFHFQLGASTDIRDTASLISSAIDNSSLPDDINEEIDGFSGAVLTCPITSFPERVCLDGTQRLGELAGTIFDILEDVDNSPVQANASASLGIAYTGSRFPIALHYRQSVTGQVQSDITQNDFNYVGTFENVLSDGALTFDELVSAVPLTINTSGNSLSLAVVEPQDELDSIAQTNALIRTQFALSTATMFSLAEKRFDIGITPKFSELRAFSLNTPIADQFDDNNDIQQQFEDTEVSESSVTVDLGVGFDLTNLPVRLSVVGRNLITERIQAIDGTVFETTPQLIIGGTYALDSLIFSADIALNEAKTDNLESQITSVGVAFKRRWFSLSAGIGNDSARSTGATALTFGLNLGPLQIGGRVTSIESAHAAAALSFKY